MNRSAAALFVLLVLVLSLCTTTLPGQSLIYRLEQQHYGGSFGHSVAGGGYLDSDAYPDIVVGLNETLYYHNRCIVEAFSGKDGTLLRTYEKDSETFGYSVALAGDLDGNGKDEVVIGTPYRENSWITTLGDVYVYSGLSQLYRWRCEALDDETGHSVAGAGDVDADGTPDVIYGAPELPGGGKAIVRSGSTGNVIFSKQGSFDEQRLGHAVAGLGDIDGDGHADVIIGAPEAFPNGPESGRAKVVSGRTATVIYRKNGHRAYASQGWSVACARDVDGDGINDFIVGAPGYWHTGVAGRATVYSGSTGRTLLTLRTGLVDDRFGEAVAGIGDWDGDGVPDLAVGAPQPYGGRGYVRVFSGSTGNVICTLYGEASGNRFGWSISAAGDVNRDGWEDLVVGAPYANRAYVFGGNLCVGSYRTFGNGLAGTGGLIPALDGSGCPMPACAVAVDVTNGLGGAPGALLIGAQRIDLAAFGGTIYPLPVTTISHTLDGQAGTAGVGTYSWTTLLPFEPLLIGENFFFQGLYLDDQAPQVISLSPGLKMRIR